MSLRGPAVTLSLPSMSWPRGPWQYFPYPGLHCPGLLVAGSHCVRPPLRRGLCHLPGTQGEYPPFHPAPDPLGLDGLPSFLAGLHGPDHRSPSLI
jgi:hypothetical protein